MSYPEHSSAVEANSIDNASWASSTDAASEKSADVMNIVQNNHDSYGDHDFLTPRASRISGMSLARRVTSVGTTGTTDPNFEVDWEDGNDPDNPRNWSLPYKSMAIGFLSWNTFVVVLFSTSYTAGVEGLMNEFNTSQTVVTLGLTFYLFGLAVGSVLLAPLSEMYGRKPVAMGSLFVFMVLIIPCGVATSIEQILVVRFFCALAGSAMISSAPGSVADIVDDDRRALALSFWSIGPLNGPVFGPIIGGFVTEYLGWRWTNWIAIIFAAIAFAFSCIMKETYAPALLQRKAARLRKEMDDPRWWSRYDQKDSIKDVLKTNLSRPFVMAVMEPICIFWNIYISIVYAILYLCFIAYPIVFRDIRGWSISMSGLAFVGIGIGGLLVVAVEPLLRRMINRHKPDPETGKPPPEAMVSVVCIAAILAPVGELWFAWSCAPTTIHWSIPILAGIPFGAGNTGVFIYSSNYLTHSYGIYAASAMAGNAVCRSIVGGVFPLVGPSLYKSLGPNWAGTLLAALEAIIIPIPFVFHRYGHKIRMKSTLIRAMQDDKSKLESKRRRAEEKQNTEKTPETATYAAPLKTEERF